MAAGLLARLGVRAVSAEQNLAAPADRARNRPPVLPVALDQPRRQPPVIGLGDYPRTRQSRKFRGSYVAGAGGSVSAAMHAVSRRRI
jgi:hypothetical protein